MPANSTHPDYDATLPAWVRARDVLAGEDAVKAAGEKYLPKLDSQSEEEYAAYKARASFFGATARTLDEYLDLVFRRAPVLALKDGEQLKFFVVDCDLWGLDFVRYARRVVGEVLAVGRGGSLVLPASAHGRLGETTLPCGRPFVSFWRAEDIINWRVERVQGRVVLVELVLRDPPSPEASAGQGGATSAERIRVLKLDGTNGSDGTNACVMEVWNPPSPEASAGQAGASGVAWVLEECVILEQDGKALSFIPFVFHGPRNSRLEPDRLPLADIIAANLDHYRLDADYKHGLHFTALPTAWVSGFDKEAPLRIGSSSAWVSEVPNATAGFLEFSGSGLAHVERAMEKVERRMALLGARMTTGVVATVGSESSGEGKDLCGLGSIVASLNQSLSQVLQLAQWWIEGGQAVPAPNAAGAAGDGGVTGVGFAMNTDLGARAMSGDEITAVVNAWRTGAISRETMLERFKRGEVLPEGRTVAQERALIHGN